MAKLGNEEINNPKLDLIDRVDWKPINRLLGRETCAKALGVANHLLSYSGVTNPFIRAGEPQKVPVIHCPEGQIFQILGRILQFFAANSENSLFISLLFQNNGR